jgi:hypothetical protein
MAATAQDVIDVLRSIDARLQQIAEMQATMAEHAGVFRPKDTHQADAAALVPTIASDADLDGKYGNLPIKAKDPREWTGVSQVGKLPSECPPEYLDLCVSRADYFSGIETDAKKLRYNRLDASRWRGWAQRLRNGWKPPVEEPSAFGTENMVDSSEVPF